VRRHLARKGGARDPRPPDEGGAGNDRPRDWATVSGSAIRVLEHRSEESKHWSSAPRRCLRSAVWRPGSGAWAQDAGAASLLVREPRRAWTTSPPRRCSSALSAVRVPGCCCCLSLLLFKYLFFKIQSSLSPSLHYSGLALALPFNPIGRTPCLQPTDPDPPIFLKWLGERGQVAARRHGAEGMGFETAGPGPVRPRESVRMTR
jgi:hypothetical protein